MQLKKGILSELLRAPRLDLYDRERIEWRNYLPLSLYMCLSMGGDGPVLGPYHVCTKIQRNVSFVRFVEFSVLVAHTI